MFLLVTKNSFFYFKVKKKQIIATLIFILFWSLYLKINYMLELQLEINIFSQMR